MVLIMCKSLLKSPTKAWFPWVSGWFLDWGLCRCRQRHGLANRPHGGGTTWGASRDALGGNQMVISSGWPANKHGDPSGIHWEMVGISIFSGWWFGCHVRHFPIYWEFHHPNWLIFFRGVQTTNHFFLYRMNLWSLNMDWPTPDFAKISDFAVWTLGTAAKVAKY